MLNLIMECLGVAILALIALGFFGICLIIWNIYIRHQSQYEQEDEEENIENEIDAYKDGIGHAAFLMQVALFKMWKDSGESVIVGSFPDIQNELNSNMVSVLQSDDDSEKWENMYLDYVKAASGSKDIGEDKETDL